jgi:ABC-type phosphate transport system permease subunit
MQPMNHNFDSEKEVQWQDKKLKVKIIICAVAAVVIILLIIFSLIAQFIKGFPLI